MKRILALIMVVAMVFAVLAFVGCDNDEDTSTSSSSTTDTSTTASSTTDTSDTTTTSSTTDTSDTTTESSEDDTTTTESSEDDTTTTESSEDDTTTTESSEDDTTTTATSESTTITSGTTVPLFARFDFGTKSKAQDLGYTTHEWLVSDENLTINSNYIALEYTEDTVIIYATQDWNSTITDRAAFALEYQNVATFDFGEELQPGFGSWNNYPYSTTGVGTNWKGRHQYMQVRILNSTTNNMISMEWWAAGKDTGFATTMIASCLYLQDGAPTTTTDHKTVAKAASTEWATYTYDLCFIGGAIRNNPGSSYKAWVDEVNKTGNIGYTNWHGTSIAITNLRFDFLGAAYAVGSSYAAFDSRANIKQGNKVEVDYVIFGSSKEQLNEYTSYIEDKANA